MNAKLFMARAGVVLKQAAPEILTGGGIVLGVAALIVACSKMKKYEEMVEETHQDIEELQNGKEERSRSENAKAYVKVGAKAVWRFLKVFWIPILLELLSITAIWYSHGMMVKRNQALASTALMLTQQLESYRERVRAKVGEETENDLFYNISKEKIGTQIEMLEDGKTKKTPVYQKVIENGAGGPFDFVLDRSNPNFQNQPGSTMGTLSMIVRSAQSIMESRATSYSDGWYMMDEMLRDLNVQPSKESFGWGWRWSRNDPTRCDTIDIGLNDYANDVVRNFMNGLEPAVPLHFNCHPLNPMTDLGLMSVKAV